jgi:hypothetical protein
MLAWSRRQKKIGPTNAIRDRSARSGPKPLARLVNSLFQIPLAYRFEQLGLAGLHSGIGPSSALSIGVAIATYVQAKPTIRINILTARFMVFSLRCEAPGRKPHGGGIIQKTVRASSLFSRGQPGRLLESHLGGIASGPGGVPNARGDAGLAPAGTLLPVLDSVSYSSTR